eukprot:3797681-Pleurochrysis_carterae.AAC.1
MTQNGESGARRGSHDDSVVAGRTALEEAGVDRIAEDVVGFTATVCVVVINRVALESITIEERGNPVRALKRTREEE